MPKRPLPALGLLMLFSLGLFLALKNLGPRSTDRPELLPTAGGAAHSPAPPADLNASTTAGSQAAPDSARSPVTRARLLVLARDESSDGPVSGALLSLGSAQGEGVLLPAVCGEWIELEPGDWSAAVVAPGYMGQELAFRIEPGQELELEAVLFAGARLSGRVVDRMGEPVGGNWVWLLADGQEYPRLPDRAEGLIGVRPDRDGGFVTDAVAPGQYRVSYGPIGRAVLETDWKLSLQSGAEPEVLVLLEGEAQLQVRVNPPPPEGRQFMFELQAQDQEHLERMNERPVRPGKEDRAEERSWRRSGGQRVREDGNASMERLRPDTYRACLKTQPGIFVSTQTFVVLPERSYELLIEQPPLPARGQRGPGEGPDPLRRDALEIQFRELPAQPDQRAAGIYRL